MCLEGKEEPHIYSDKNSRLKSLRKGKKTAMKEAGYQEEDNPQLR